MHPETVPQHESIFPILATITRTGESVVFQSPKEIPSGVAFKILVTRYRPCQRCKPGTLHCEACICPNCTKEKK